MGRLKSDLVLVQFELKIQKHGASFSLSHLKAFYVQR